MTAAVGSYRDNRSVWRKTETELVGQKEPHKLLSSGDTQRTRTSGVAGVPDVTYRSTKKS